MFDQPNPISQPKAPVEDIFDAVNEAPSGYQGRQSKPGGFSPLSSDQSAAKRPEGQTEIKSSLIPPGGIVPSAPSSPLNDNFGKGSVLIKNKKFFIIGLIALVIIVLATGGWFAYAKFFKKSAGVNINATNTSQNNINTNENVNTNELNINSPVNSNVNQNVNQEIVSPKPAENVDSDNDGLIDEEEIKLGTNPDLPDTDNDGLFDREEVMTFKTDPLNADTDGDGYLDGAEVKSGYDPRGPGKLYNAEQIK